MSLQSWGRYPKIKSKKYQLTSNFKLDDSLNNLIPYGNGRSYGDSCLSYNILTTKANNYFLEFDENSGLLHAQSGVLLSEIIETFVPKGWFLKITPGTKFITIGGAIASDVHGKNHHIEGCFSECIESFNILLADGTISECSKNSNYELFKATCGGMGLTGIILDAKIYLKKITSKHIHQTTVKTKNLKETFDAFEAYKNFPYSVAWIDCFAKKNNIGKSLLMLGEFAKDKDLNYTPKKNINIPFNFPNFLLNSISIKLFNFLYYRKVVKKISKNTVDIDAFFYPLDSIKNWNRIYGKNGFTQYQFILPKENSFEGMHKILQKIAATNLGSFLAVLKLYGPQNNNYLSFPIEGYSLALDFKINEKTFKLLNELDEIVVEFGGRIYLTKDVRVSKKVFEKGYPNINTFRKFRINHGMKTTFNSLQSNRLDL